MLRPLAASGRDGRQIRQLFRQFRRSSGSATSSAAGSVTSSALAEFSATGAMSYSSSYDSEEAAAAGSAVGSGDSAASTRPHARGFDMLDPLVAESTSVLPSTSTLMNAHVVDFFATAGVPARVEWDFGILRDGNTRQKLNAENCHRWCRRRHWQYRWCRRWLRKPIGERPGFLLRRPPESQPPPPLTSSSAAGKRGWWPWAAGGGGAGGARS